MVASVLSGLWTPCCSVFVPYGYNIFKECENLCNPKEDTVALLSSFGSGGSGLFKSGGGTGGRGFDVTAAGREDGSICLGPLYWSSTSVCSGMM